MNFSERLKKACEERGWKQVDLKNKSGLSPGSINAYWHGESDVRGEHLQHLARLLGVSMDYLYGADDAEPLALHDTGPSAEAETRRANAADAKLERAKKHLRTALAELEAEPSYRRASLKPLSALQEAAKKAGGG